jgi:hypothetical protein
MTYASPDVCVSFQRSSASSNSPYSGASTGHNDGFYPPDLALTHPPGERRATTLSRDRGSSRAEGRLVSRHEPGTRVGLACDSIRRACGRHPWQSAAARPAGAEAAATAACQRKRD